MGGGSCSDCHSTGMLKGRSPRGRGKRAHLQPSAPFLGSIPAWAGEAQTLSNNKLRSRVDPRVGGGSKTFSTIFACSEGRSPRGRGKLSEPCLWRPLHGSIPAWAGEARGRRRTWRCGGVDPRVGGGSRWKPTRITPTSGRSPRGRGKLIRWGAWRDRQGSIPAWAGEAWRGSSRRRRPRVDPRVGGGSYPRNLPRVWPWGRSPRGRGKRHVAQRGGVELGSIPAWAGEARP